MEKNPCETCPHRIPMDRRNWDRIAESQRQVTPQLSRKQNTQLTRIERRIFDGLESNVDKCGGYSPVKSLANFALSKVSVGHRIKTTETGGTRPASWHERTCNNPFLDSPEYFALQDEFDAVGKANINPFKTAKQRGAFLAGEAEMQKALLGGLMVVGSLGVPGDGVVERIAESGLFGGGIVLGATGLWKSMAHLRTEFREHRQN